MSKSYLIPKKFKYKKLQKEVIRTKGISNSNFIFSFNCFVVKSLFYKRLFPTQYESFRRVVKRFLKKEGNLLNYSICDFPLTKKSLGVRMGKGKGGVYSWASNIKKGRILYSLSNVNLTAAKFVLEKASKKIDSRTLIVKINDSNYFRFNKKFFD